MFDILSTVKIEENKNLVISQSNKGITIAQQLAVKEQSGYVNKVYLKGSLHLSNVDSLIDLRNAINLAIEKVTKEKKEGE